MSRALEQGYPGVICASSGNAAVQPQPTRRALDYPFTWLFLQSAEVETERGRCPRGPECSESLGFQPRLRGGSGGGRGSRSGEPDHHLRQLLRV